MFHAVSKKVAFLIYLKGQEGCVSARKVAEGVQKELGIKSGSAERSLILNNLWEERLVHYRRPRGSERETPQQRCVWGLTPEGEIAAIAALRQAKALASIGETA